MPKHVGPWCVRPPDARQYIVIASPLESLHLLHLASWRVQYHLLIDLSAPMAFKILAPATKTFPMFL